MAAILFACAALSALAEPPVARNVGALQRPVDRFCRGTNQLFRSTVFPAVREAVDIREADDDSARTYLEKALSPPTLPGRSRPASLVILASVPTALVWYGFYKFSIEEELFHDELQRDGVVSGCGGYGTLFPFVWAILIGGAGTLAGVPGSEGLIELGALWILLGQVNLYRRVNELCEESLGEQPLHSWWALLPPPFDVIVGLRQVHFLARHWATVRGETWETDAVAEKYFPFIAEQRFTLRGLLRRPSMWFWFTKDAADIELPSGPDWLPRSLRED